MREAIGRRALGVGEHTDPTAKEKMLQAVIECCLAGNLFDAGSAAAVQGVASDDAEPEPEVGGCTKLHSVDPWMIETRLVSTR